MMKQTYIRHRLGVRVFTMEGFKYKNYSSNQAVNNRTNMQKDIEPKSLQLQFDCNYFDVKREKSPESSNRKAQTKQRGRIFCYI